MKAALKAKTHYLDMATRVEGGTIDDGYLLQIALDEEFRAIGRTALIHTGMTPGVTNTLTAIGYEEMERCEAVRIKAGSCFKSEVPIQVWSQETYYIDSQTPTLYFDDGKFLRAEPFAGWEYVDFPAPVGRVAAVLHEHEECSTLPRFLPKLGEKGLKHLDFKLAGGEEGMKKAKILVETGIASPIPRKVRGQEVRPIDVLVSVLPPSAPKEEIARLATEGRIVDEGVYLIELFAREGEPADGDVLRLPAQHPAGHRDDPRAPTASPTAPRLRRPSMPATCSTAPSRRRACSRRRRSPARCGLPTSRISNAPDCGSHGAALAGCDRSSSGYDGQGGRPMVTVQAVKCGSPRNSKTRPT